MIPAPTMELTRLEEAPRMDDFFWGRESSLSLVVGALGRCRPPASVSKAAAGRMMMGGGGGAPPVGD